MSSSSQIIARIIREATLGITPGTAMQEMLFERLDLEGGIEREKPGNVRSNRQVVDNPATDIKPAMSATADCLFGGYLIFEESAMAAAYAAGATVTASISAVASGNKLVGPGGSWAGIAEGDFVTVSGFTTNGSSFLARVSGAPTSTDLPLDADWKTLQAEGPVTVTVAFTRRGRLGSSLLSQTVELWNPNAVPAARGDISRGVIVREWGFGFQHPNKWSQTFQGVSLSKERLAVRLANSTTAASTNPLWNSNTNFGDALNASRGGGFRYGGGLMPDLRIQKIQATIVNPVTAYGGAGSLGPSNACLDEMFEVKLDITVDRDSADAETLIDDAQDPATVTSIAFVQADSVGNRRLHYFPYLQPSQDKESGLAQAGKEMVDVSYIAKYHPVHGMFQITDFAAA